MREEFEAHYKKEINPDGPFTKDGIPSSYYASIYWEAWQASRAARVVELPEMVFVSGYDLYTPASIEMALDKAGIKYE